MQHSSVSQIVRQPLPCARLPNAAQEAGYVEAGDVDDRHELGPMLEFAADLDQHLLIERRNGR